MIVQHEEALSKIMGLHSSAYENFIFLSDFNVGMEHVVLKDFFNFYSLTNLINKILVKSFKAVLIWFLQIAQNIFKTLT